jgi:Ca-activated chloride channel family protein
VTVLPSTSIHFQDPGYLSLLVVPAVALLLWMAKAAGRRRDVRRLRAEHVVPVRERIAGVGPLWTWLALIAALALTIAALARPTAAVSIVRTAGVDLIVLQDGSASMHVPDVQPDRWQRSMAFLRVLAETMQWSDDRLAFAVFAHIAAPQVRLTRDPNTVFFFLEHLAEASPFPLQEDSTWDTNIEIGVRWGMRLMEKDAELNGSSPNGKAMVIVSDGQAWSGSIREALNAAHAKELPVFVVGVGTQAGGHIPEPPQVGPRPASAASSESVSSRLDRASLLAIAADGRGRYFELDRERDRTIAASIIAAARQRAGSRGTQTTVRELYWYCLLAAAAFMIAGAAAVRDLSGLWLQLSVWVAVLGLVWTLAR